MSSFGVIARPYKNSKSPFVFCMTESKERAISLYNIYKPKNLKEIVLIGIGEIPDNYRTGDYFNGIIEVI